MDGRADCVLDGVRDRSVGGVARPATAPLPTRCLAGMDAKTDFARARDAAVERGLRAGCCDSIAATVRRRWEAESCGEERAVAEAGGVGAGVDVDVGVEVEVDNDAAADDTDLGAWTLCADALLLLLLLLLAGLAGLRCTLSVACEGCCW